MSQENVELRALAEAAFGAVNSGDLESLVALTTEDVEFTSMVAEAEGTTFRGHDGVRTWWKTVRGTFDAVRWELLDVRGSGDRGVAHFRMAGTLGSVPVEQTMWSTVKLRDGRVFWYAFFRTEGEALEAAGLSEAMSQENVELVYRAADAFNRHDLDASLALMDDDVQAFPQVAAMEGNYDGHDGIRRWWKSLFDVFPDYTSEVVEVRDLGDMTVASVILRGHGAGSDVPAEDMVWLVHRWRDGKCIWWRSFNSRAAALEAAGLSE